MTDICVERKKVSSPALQIFLKPAMIVQIRLLCCVIIIIESDERYKAHVASVLNPKAHILYPT